jgi:hypothetical protein
MRLEIYYGMAKDKLYMTFVEWQAKNHNYDPKDKDQAHRLLPAQEDQFAVPGGAIANEQQIRFWADGFGYHVKRKFA